MSATGVNPQNERHETEDEKADRNWTDILQEMRVSQTGTQIISGFLLAVAFQQRFKELGTPELFVYGVLVILAAVSTALGIATVALHRGTFRRHEKPVAVELGDRVLRVAAATVGLLSVGAVLLLFDFVFGEPAGIIASVTVGIIIVGLTLLLPARARQAARRRADKAVQTTRGA